MVSDFTASSKFKPDQLYEDILGKIQYQAPEVVKQSYNSECDIWSVGVITYQLLCGELPFGMDYMKNEDEIVKMLKGKPELKFEQDQWDAVTNECKAFIYLCLDNDAESRFTSDSALMNTWFKKKAPKAWRISKKQKAEQEANRLKAENNLKQFNAKNKIVEAVKAYSSCSDLTQKQKDKYEQIFNNIKGPDGDALSRKQLIENNDKIQMSGSDELMTDDDIDAFIKLADKNQDGEISLEEFIEGATEYERMNAEELLKKAFALFDKDGDGSIEAPELLDALQFLPNFD